MTAVLRPNYRGPGLGAAALNFGAATFMQMPGRLLQTPFDHSALACCMLTSHLHVIAAVSCSLTIEHTFIQ